MSGFEFILEERLKLIEDFKKNQVKYFRNIKKISRKYNGKSYLFGSFVKKKFYGGSDIDVLVFIPHLTRKKKWKILEELKDKVNRNPIFEFHVVGEDEFSLYKKFIKELKAL